MQPVPAKPVTRTPFPVGYYHFHDNVSLNFQLNRWVNWLGPSAIDDMRNVAPKIKNYADWKREMLALAEATLAQGRTLNAAFYFRGAEFFMATNDPDKKPTRERFVRMVKDHYGIRDADRHLIPYETGCLPAFRFCPEHPKGTLVCFGGFDSYVEELLPIMLPLEDAGYDVIIFEGPGQGGALEEYGLPMTHEWEKPVKTVLDYFNLDKVTLLGLSLGGCLVLRAAAHEPRVERAVADDILFNFQEVLLSSRPKLVQTIINGLLRVKASGVVNALFSRMMKRDLLVEWGVNQGMHVMGASTPFDFLYKMRNFTTADISALVKQDVLLLAGSEDHYIPLHQFYQQIEALKNVRSLTARLFTRAEQAQNHCQVGNIGLSLDVILAWLDAIGGATMA